ncbi:MAG: hypothetical protein MZU95_07000 [Desulfomicrobium escambiense]|nr:hypothetical protein [Desulfomicrobium escambiense]
MKKTALTVCFALVLGLAQAAASRPAPRTGPGRTNALPRGQAPRLRQELGGRPRQARRAHATGSPPAPWPARPSSIKESA